jgi:hypothetical protein
LLPGTFTNRVAAAAAMRRFAVATEMNIYQAPGQNDKWIAWRCNNYEQCRCQFNVHMHRPMCKGILQPHWILSHTKCTWVHDVTCYSAPMPRALDVANDTAVREHITAFKTLGAAKANVDAIKRFVEKRGIQIPRQSGSQDRKSNEDQQRRFCLRVCERVLGYDDEGLSQSLCKLFPWCTSFKDSGTGDSHLEIRDGEFVAVVITWHTSTTIVAECGFRVVALDAAVFEYMRKDLRLFIIVGYTSNNTLMPLAMMIAFNEDLPAYLLFFRTLKKFSLAATPDTNSSVLANANGSSRVLWTFLDNEGTSVIADQGPLRCTRKAFNQVFLHAELRSCSRHIIGNCLKRAQALDSNEQGLLFDLAKCDDELGVASLLSRIKEHSTKLYDYILLDDHYTHWVRFFLRDTFDARKDTSNGAEQFFSAAKAKKFRQLRPLDALMEITTYVGELQRDFFRDAERRVSHNADGVPMTEYLEERYEREKRRASTLHMVGVPASQIWNIPHRVSCCEQDPRQGYPYHTISSNPPTEVVVRFERQVGCSVVVTCTSARCKSKATGYVCRHACVVGAHDFEKGGKLIERDNGAWWLRNMIRKEYHCTTIRDLAEVVTPTMSPPMPGDTAAAPPIRMPVMRAENRSDLKPGRYRAFHESSDKGRAPPKRIERDLVAEAARDLVLELDESDACLAVVYNQTTAAKFADGSATKGRARPVRVIRAGPTRAAQPRLTVTIHCYLSNQVTDLLVEHISFAQPITEQTARVTAITGKWFHPDEPANPQARASADMVMDRSQLSLPTINPAAARGLIEQALVGQYFMVVYTKPQLQSKPSKGRPVTTYLDGTPTDSVRPRPFQKTGYYFSGDKEFVSVVCCLSKRRKKFALGKIKWAQQVDQSVAECEGCSGSWLPARTSVRLHAKRKASTDGNNTAAPMAKKASNAAGPGAATSHKATTGAAVHSRQHSNTRKQPVAATTKPHHAGVNWDKNEGKWRGRVGHRGKMHSLGYFKSWDDCVAAVEKERRRLQQLS